MMNCKKVVSDVLIVGGGGAGVMSAVSAARNGASVSIAVKGKIGKSGNYIMLGGSFGVDGPSAKKYCNEPEANLEYTQESLFNKMVASAFQIGDQRLQKHFVEEAPFALHEFFKWVEESGAKFIFSPKACRWRTSGVAFGSTLKLGLENQSKESHIGVFEDTVITDLLTAEGKVCGALGLEIYTGELVEFQAKSVVLATGGYQPFSLKNTCSDMTGDGIAMALLAGAQVKDMEFLLHIPTLIEPTYAKGTILPFQMTMPNLFPLRQRVFDLDGEELIYPTDSKYKTTAENSKVKKLLMHYFYGKSLYEKWDKYGNQFYFDYSDYTDQEIRDAFGVIADNMSYWYKNGKYHYIDIQELAEHVINNQKRLLVGLGNEYSMGGVVVDETFATRVPGLFAAGEVTGGVFGAFRSGDGITEMLAHGLTAGRTASDYCKEASHLEPADLEEKIEALLAPMARNEGLSPIEGLMKLEAICDEGFNIFRDEARLENAHQAVHSLREELKGLSVPNETKYNLELVNSVVLRNLSLCAQAGIFSALNRRESRGTHMRSDYPEVNNHDYQFSYVAALEKGSLAYTKSYPQEIFMTLDKDNYPDVAQCISVSIMGVKE